MLTVTLFKDLSKINRANGNLLKLKISRKMAAPPWRPASRSHRNDIHFNHKFNRNNTQSHSHSHSPFHSNTTLLAYARSMHISLTKITGFRTPLSFNIKMHNGIPTIAYYVRYLDNQASQTNTNTTTHQSQHPSKTSTLTNNIIKSTSPVSSNNFIAPTKKSDEIFSNITHDQDESNILSRNKPPRSAIRHSPAIKLISQLHEQKWEIENFENTISTLNRDMALSAALFERKKIQNTLNFPLLREFASKK